MHRTLAILIVLAAGGIARAADPAPSAEGVEYFEKHVRPLLIDACYKCHSAESDKLKGGLYVDSKAGLLKGGKNGPAVVPGDLDKSLLIKAVRYEDDELAMPPKKALTKDQVAVLETWVKMGAPDPRVEQKAKPGELTVLSMADANEFWSFKKPVEPAIPATSSKWARTPIDRFILAKLEAAGLEPAAEADKRTLIRRATFDLTGLPPTAQEVAAFEADASPDAFEKVIDRLLASPAYGERWARHWLDVARYADTKGYVFQEERRYPFAYTYRDWVVRAFNQDLPYDQFLVHQLAADRVVAKDPQADKSNLAAMGFLTLGRRFLNNQADIIDDRMDTVFRGTMGLTVACARCHDHKFDPIPTADYYSLYGVFASSVEPGGAELPLLEEKEKSAQSAEFEKELAARQSAIDKFKQERFAQVVAPLRKPETIAKYLLGARELRRGGEVRQVAQAQDLRRGALQKWRETMTKPEHAAVFGPFQALMDVPEKDLPAAPLPAAKDPKKPYNAVIVKAFEADKPKTRADVARVFAAALAKHDTAEAPSDANAKAVWAVFRGAGSPVEFTVAEVDQLFNRDDRNKLQELARKRDALTATHAGAPARAMVLQDAPSPVTPVIFKRGNPGMPGAQVPRQFLLSVAGDDRKPFAEGSGRLELARTIASPDNPFTARVMVNRVWHHHFGKGIVRTPSDFGVRGERPTHPELLDYLAVQFVKNGWSIKKLHKAIMTSAAYRQRSTASDKALQADPENRLVSRQNRQRLGIEALRDSLLFATGQLDRTVGGKPVDLLAQPFPKRRTLYGFIDRQNLPSMFRAFDFASPDQSAPMRFANTVPQQALFMMNSPFVVEQARAVAARDAVAKAPTPDEKVRALYRATLSREPSTRELELGLTFVEHESRQPTTRNADPKAGAPLNPWEKYAQVLLQTNEFVFVD